MGRRVRALGAACAIARRVLHLAVGAEEEDMQRASRRVERGRRGRRLAAENTVFYALVLLRKVLVFNASFYWFGAPWGLHH